MQYRLFLTLFCLVTYQYLYSMDELDESSFTLIHRHDQQEMFNFLINKCQNLSDFNENSFKSIDSTQWNILTNLSLHEKNDLLATTLDNVDDADFPRIRNAIACLVCAGASVEQKGHRAKDNALERAVMYDDIDVADYLLANGGNPNQKLGLNPIFFLAKSVKMAKLFKKYNTQFTQKDGFGSCVLHQVICSPEYEPELISFYLKQGIDVKTTKANLLYMN